jgi:tetratricopeptide (TPR) repeat protein
MKRLIFLLMPIMAFVLSYKSEAQTSMVKEELAKAQSLTIQGNREEASKIYTGIMANYPDNREAAQEWIVLNVKMGGTIGYEEVIKQLEKLEKSYPNNTGVLFWKSFIQVGYKHYDEALAGYNTLITLFPDTAVYWQGKAEMLSFMNRNEEALKAIEKATSLDPKRDDFWAEQADVLSKLGRYEEAILTYNKAVKLDPKNAVNIYNRGCAYCLKGDKANALADLKKAISLNPGLKEYACKDENFKSLWDNGYFKTLIIL